jgi:autotransporter translocation and assembly factor TamB
MLRRLARAAAWLVLVLFGVALVGALVMVLWARSDAGRRAILARVLPGVQERLAGTLRIGALEGDLTRTLVLRDVELRDGDGDVAIRVARVAMSYNLTALLRHELEIDDLVVEGASVRAHTLSDGRFNLIALVRAATTTSSAGAKRAIAVAIHRARADVALHYDPPPGKRWMSAIDGTVQLDASATSAGGASIIDVRSLAVRMAQPVVARADIGGSLAADASGATVRALRVTGDVDGAEIEKLSHRLPVRGRWHAEVRAHGPLRAMAVEVAVTPPTGTLAVHGTVGVTGAGATWSGTATARALDPGAMWAPAPHGLLAFDGGGDGKNARVRLSLAKLVADVAGVHATGAGELTYDDGLVLTTSADASAHDLARLSSLGAAGLVGAAVAHATFERRAGHSTIEATVDAKHAGGAGARVAALRARVNARDFDGAVNLRATGVDVGPRLHFDAVTLTAKLAPRSITLAVTTDGPKGSEVVVQAHGRRLRDEGPFAGALALDRVSLAVRGDHWQMSAPGQVRLDRRGVAAKLMLANGAQRLELDGRYDHGAVQAHVATRSLDVRRLGSLLQLDRDLPPAVVDAEGSVRGTVAHPAVDLALTLALAADRARGWPRSVWRLGGGHYDERRIAGDVSIGALALGRLAPYLPKTLADLKGVAAGTAMISGSPRAPAITATIEVPRWQWDVLQQNKTHVELRYGAQRLDARVTSSFATGPAGDAGGVDVELFAPIDLSRGLSRGTTRFVDRLLHTTPITVAIRMRALDLARLPLARLGVSEPVAAGIVDGEVKLGGTLHEPTLYAALDARGLTVAGVSRIDLGLQADYGATGLALSLTGDLAGARLLTATADSPLDFHKLIDGQRWQDASLRGDAAILGYDLSRWKQLHGALTAHAKVGGTLAHPEVAVDLTAPGLRVGEMRFARFAGAGHYDARHSTVRLDAEEIGGGALHATGERPAGADQPIAARVRIEELALALGKGGLGPVRELRGKVNADMTVSGTLAHPHAAGSLNLVDGAFALSAQPLLYRQMALSLTAANDRVVLQRLAVKINNGALVATGSATLDGFDTPLGVDLSARATHFPLRLGSFAAFVDGHATLHGARQDGVLVVTARLDDGLAQLPRLVDGKRPQSLSPMPDLVYTDRAEVRHRAAVAAELAEDAPVRASLNAHIPGPFRVRSSELGTDLQGDLDVEILGEVMRISGSVHSTWGRIDLLGRRYEIERVAVGFDGSPDPDPTLDVKITRVVDEATVIIQVRGTLKHPQLELSSEPAVYSESQIIGIIVSGDPGSTRIADASIDQKVVGAISGVLVNQIKSQIAPGLPIDVIRIDQNDASSGTSRLEVGKYLTDKIYLSYVHQFGAPTGIHPVNANEAQVQYRFRRHYQLETRFGDAGVGAINFYWSLRY